MEEGSRRTGEALAAASSAAPDALAEGGIITANVLRVTLQALQMVTVGHYAPLLTAAGLTRYLTTLPPDDWSPAATGVELGRLYHTVYEILGEGLTQLFHRNCGEAYIAGTLQSAWTQRMIAQAAHIGEDAKLGWLVHELAALAGRGWAHHALSADDRAWYLAAEFCPLCLGIHGVAVPLCAQAPALFAGLARAIIGHRVPVVEVECAALGAAQCKFALYK